MQEINNDEQKFLKQMKLKMSNHSAMNHEFLIRFEKEVLSIKSLRKFGVQWYKTAKKHKEAFPAIIYNVKDDDIRFDLIEILNEEYGTGDRTKIHARLLQKFLRALNVSDEDVENTETLPEVKVFGNEVLNIWKDGNEVYAFGLHFALEYLASSLHCHFSNGLEKYDFLSKSDREYFNFHKVAEVQHADFSENGMLIYGKTEENRKLLRKGVEKGVELMQMLWDSFYQHIFVEVDQKQVAIAA